VALFHAPSVQAVPGARPVDPEGKTHGSDRHRSSVDSAQAVDPS